jgi:hypothetical protein
MTKPSPVGAVKVSHLCGVDRLVHPMNPSATKSFRRRKSHSRSRKSSKKSSKSSFKGRRARFSNKRTSYKGGPRPSRRSRRYVKDAKPVPEAAAIPSGGGNILSPIADVVKNVASSAGGALDALTNGMFGAMVSGVGDYELSTPSVLANSLVHPTLAESVPSFGAEQGHVMLSHREYLRDISVPSGQSTYTDQLTINPGDVRTFPWLSRIAVNFEQYRLVGCIFEFVSTSTASTTNPNPALWTVSMATQYNVNQRAMGSKRQFLNHFFSSSGVAAANVMHAIECREELTAVTPKYVRNSDIDPVLVSDARLLDVGRFAYWLEGGAVQAVNQILGELHITYQIALLKPRLQIATTGLTYDGPDDALPDPEADIKHLPEIQTLCCGEIELLSSRLAALEAEEKKDGM